MFRIKTYNNVSVNSGIIWTCPYCQVVSVASVDTPKKCSFCFTILPGIPEMLKNQKSRIHYFNRYSEIMGK